MIESFQGNLGESNAASCVSCFHHQQSRHQPVPEAELLDLHQSNYPGNQTIPEVRLPDWVAMGIIIPVSVPLIGSYAVALVINVTRARLATPVPPAAYGKQGVRQERL